MEVSLFIDKQHQLHFSVSPKCLCSFQELLSLVLDKSRTFVQLSSETGKSLPCPVKFLLLLSTNLQNLYLGLIKC